MRSFKEICEEESLTVSSSLIRNSHTSFLFSKQNVMIFEGDNEWENGGIDDDELGPLWPWLVGVFVTGAWLLFVTAPKYDFPWWTPFVAGLLGGCLFQLGKMLIERFSKKNSEEGFKKEHILTCGDRENYMEIFRSPDIEEVKLVRLEIEKIMLEGKR